MRIAAEQKIWRNGVAKAKRYADARGTIQTLKEAQKQGLTSDEIQLDQIDNIHDMVNTAKEQAEAAAFNALPREMILGIQQRIDERNRQKLNAQTGNILVPTR